MLRREYLTLKRRLQCGDLSCFLSCCSQIPTLIEAFQALSDAEVDLLLYEVCGSCDGVGSVGGTQPGGTGGTVGQVPGYNPGTQDALFACLSKLQGLICTTPRVTAMQIAKPVLVYIRTIIPSQSPVQPILAAYEAAIGAFLTFCSNPTNNGALIALQAICKYWSIIAGIDPTSMTSTLGAAGGTLPSVLATIFDKELRDTLTACCAALAAMPPTAGQPSGGSTDAGGIPGMPGGIPGLPPGTIPGATGTAPSDTNPGDLVRPIISSITQMAIGPESPLHNVNQSFSSMPDGWPPKL